MQIQVNCCNTEEGWSASLSDYDYSLFITPAWVKALQTSDRKPVYIDFIHQGTIIAKLAGLHFESGPAWKRKLYFHAGPALKKDADRSPIEGCMLSLIKFARKNRIGRIVMLSYDYHYRIAIKSPFRFNERQELIVNLSIGMDQILKNFSKSIHSKHKNAIKEGCVFSEQHGAGKIEPLLDLLNKTKELRMTKGYENYNPFYIPLFTKESLMRLATDGSLKIFVVEKDSRLIGMNIIMTKEDRAYGMLTGTAKEGYALGVPSFLDYSLIVALKNEGYRYINFGGVPIETKKSGLYHFKKSLGALPVKCVYGSTNFLYFPYNLLNPLMNLARILPENKLVKRIQRKI